jgi:hypothetical protein
MSRSSERHSPPQYVYDNYKQITSSALIAGRVLNDDSIAEFQQLLNYAQPQNERDSTMRSIVQYLYRKNPGNFCRFLTRSRLSHLVLWTEAKCIVRHFKLQNIVYVKWNSGSYECSLHRQARHPAVQQTHDSISGNARYNRQNNRNQRYRPRRHNRQPVDTHDHSQQTDIHEGSCVRLKEFPPLTDQPNASVEPVVDVSQSYANIACEEQSEQKEEKTEE